MGIDKKTLALAKSYTDKSMQGAGAVAGKPCQIQNIEDITGGHRVTFLWVDNAGTSHTSAMDVKDGIDAVQISDIVATNDNKIKVIMADGTEYVTTEIPTIQGEEGKSAYEVAVEQGYSGTEEEWLASLKGEQGDAGEGVPEGGTAGQVLVKKSNTDYDTEWDTPAGGGDMLKSVYDTDNDGKVNSAENADTVNGHTVAKDVPADAVFTDTVYDDTEIRGEIADKVDKVDGKGLSTEDYSSEEKTKLGSIETGAEVNTIESISLNGVEVTPDANKNVALTVITKAVNDLVNYYLKSETYSKTEVDDIVTAIKNSRFEVVATLPTTDIKTNVIYLVPKNPTQTSNVKDEYINLDGTTAGWEKIGDTEIDLSDYVTTQALNTALANYTTTADLTTLLAAKQDTLTFDNAPTENSNNPVKSGGVYAVNEALTNRVKGNWSEGGKNKLPNNIYGTTTNNGVTVSRNNDGSLNISGTNTYSNVISISLSDAVWGSNSGGEPWLIDDYLDRTQTYTMSISEPDVNVRMRMTFYDSSKQVISGAIIETRTNRSMTIPNEAVYAIVRLAISQGATVQANTVVYPMVRLASDTDSTYQPYAKTNQELTVETQALTNQTNGIVNVLGAKNVLPFPYYAGSGTYNGVTITDNGDGSITLDGTCTGMSFFVFYGGRYSLAPTTFVKKNEDYIATLEVVSGSMAINSGTSRFVFRDYITNATSPFVDIFYEENVIDTRSVKFTYEPTASYDTSLVWYEFNVGTTFNNWRIRPMIRLASIQDDTYEPYAKTNQELTSNVTAIDNARIMYGVENILPNTLGSGTAATSVTYTRNSDGTVSISGSAVGNAILPIGKITGLTKVRLTGCPSGGGSSAYQIQPKDLTDNSYPFLGDYGEGKNYTLDPTHVYRMDIVIREGYSISGTKLFKPMVVDLSAYSGTTYGDYVPYAKTNQQLTKDTTGLLDNLEVNGAVNMLPNNFTTQTINGITWTVNDDGSVTANGTSTADWGIRYSFTPSFSGNYKFTGCPKEGSYSSWWMNLVDVTTSTNYNDLGSGMIIPIIAGHTYSHRLYIHSGKKVSNLTFKPMITVASYNGDYVPYTKTNRELTKNVEELSTNATKLVDLSTPVSIFDVLTDRSLYPSSNVYWSTSTKLTNGSDTFSSLLSINGNAIVRIDVYSEWYIGIEINDASHGNALIAWANKTTTQLKFIQINTSTSPYVSQVTINKAP